jgi:negative regulator of flagellin synthesis FlgM
MLKLADEVKNSADVREDRIAEIKEKMNNPSYIDNDVLDDVAEKLMEAFGL